MKVGINRIRYSTTLPENLIKELERVKKESGGIPVARLIEKACLKLIEDFDKRKEAGVFLE